MRRQWNGKLHKVRLAMNSAGWSLRYCENCGATWQMIVEEDGGYAFRPVKELGPDGKELEIDVDVRECNAETPITAPVEVPTPVVVAPVTDERKCYCGDCHKAGRKQHYPGDDMCYCPRHKGRERHKIA